MSKAIDVLRHKIAVRKVSADNKNYDIGLTIVEGEAILAELQNQPEPGEFTKEGREILKALKAEGMIPEPTELGIQRYSVSSTGVVYLDRDGDLCLWEIVKVIIDQQAEQNKEQAAKNKEQQVEIESLKARLSKHLNEPETSTSEGMERTPEGSLQWRI